MPIVGWSTQQLPWFGTSYEIEWRSDIAFQTYKNIDHDGHSIRYPSDGCFVHTSLCSAFGKNEEWAAELEATAAQTEYHRFALDNIRLTGRYALSDDILGDSWSAIIGLTVTQAGDFGVNDMSSFHHGKLEGEFHFSFGRETACNDEWRSRWWALIGLGTAYVGQPWSHLKATYEFRFQENQELAFFIDLLKGFGAKPLNPHDFEGYGDINHQSVDIGCRYTYLIDFFGSLSLEYVNRVYARNFPVHAQVFRLCVFYPFGL